MKRRTFLKAGLGATSFAAANQAISTTSSAQTDSAQPGQYYELRTYSIQSERQQKLVGEYWRAAAIPAYNRMGIRPIGAFTELDKLEISKICVLIPYDSLDLLASVNRRLAADNEYQKAGAEYLDVPKSDPAYVRFESSLLIAFEGMKKLEVPQPPSEQKPWIFELRVYESHSEAKGINKVKMFNSGEIPLMHEVGLAPVFFGQSLIGSRLPNLIYMVSGESKEAHQKHWKGFFDAPVWKKLIGDPQYKDNVSKVTSTFLKRTSYSQI